MTKSFRTMLSFTKDDPLYQKVKPYGFKYPPKNGYPNTNIIAEEADDVLVQDIRAVRDDRNSTTIESPFTLEDNGFTVARIQNLLSYDDYMDPEKVMKYFDQLEYWLKQHLNAATVKVFRYHIRKRHVTWPDMIETVYEFDQPATHVHIDATREGCIQEMQMHHNDEYVQGSADRPFQWFNFWKPLVTPPAGLNDWPLILCDASTVNGEHDTMPADLIYPTYATENTQVFYRSKYRWYYLSDQQLDEILVFKQADSDPSHVPGVPHCSVQNPLSPTDDPPRESIEVRAMAYF